MFTFFNIEIMLDPLKEIELNKVSTFIMKRFWYSDILIQLHTVLNTVNSAHRKSKAVSIYGSSCSSFIPTIDYVVTPPYLKLLPRNKGTLNRLQMVRLP